MSKNYKPFSGVAYGQDHSLLAPRIAPKMYRSIVLPTLREQKTQISLAHMSAAHVLFADIGPAVRTAISSKGLLAPE